jgi:hypothetical protein
LTAGQEEVKLFVGFFDGVGKKTAMKKITHKPFFVLVCQALVFFTGCMED